MFRIHDARVETHLRVFREVDTLRVVVEFVFSFLGNHVGSCWRSALRVAGESP